MQPSLMIQMSEEESTLVSNFATPVEFSKEELLIAMRHDCVTFFSFYLGDELTMEVPQFHIDIWDELLIRLDEANDNSMKGIMYALRKLFAVPREHAKSTIAKLAVILFLKYSRLSFVLYASKTTGHAKNACRDIMKWLSSSQEQELFGIMRILRKNDSDGQWEFEMMIREKLTGKVIPKTVVMRALGADQQVRGLLIDNKRPQIVIVDDIEDLDNTTPDLQPKLDAWFMASFLKAFDSRSNICIYIGNMIRDTTILARLSKEPEWNPTIFGCLVRGVDGIIRPLWEGKHTLESLLKEYRFYRRMGNGHQWEAEMMNLTQDIIMKSDLNITKVLHVPSPDDITCGGICLDPAFGQKSFNDSSAITVHVRTGGIGIPYIIESRVGKFTEDELFDILLELSEKWGLWTWCIESDAAQKLIIPYFTLLAQSRKFPPGMIQMLPLLSGRNTKASRILAFKKSVSAGSYGIVDSESELMEHLEEYNPDSSKHDDLCDSAAYGPIMWTFHGSLIETSGVRRAALESSFAAFGSDDFGQSDFDPYSETQVAAF